VQRTELETLGEFGLIDRITQHFALQNPESVVGIGDDCAVIETGSTVYQLLSTDLLTEGVHFDLSYYPLRHLGYKAVAVNVSDIAAMNGIPKQITVSIALSNRFSVEAVEELYEGIRFACEDFKVDLVGGDTTSSRSGLMISVTVVGTVAKDKITYRKGAKENEILCVTGDLGGAYMGLQVLEREKQVFLSNPEMQPELEGKDYIIQRQLKPIARTDMVYELAEAGVVPTAMIDISDGLASELLHLCKACALGAVVFEEKIPLDESTFQTALDFNIAPHTCALNGGEDYELLFTVKQADYDKIRLNPNITAIGYMIPQAEGVKMQSKSGTIVPITAQGWQHF
jgi:thiamine-monophosphate kinase